MISNLTAAFLCMLFVTLGHIRKTRKDFRIAGQPFLIKKYFRDEFEAIAMSVIFVIIMAITVKEWIYVHAKAKDYVTCLFGLGGAIGSWCFQEFLGGSKNYIRKVIDLKTNIVDNELGQSTTITELKKKAENAGKDISSPSAT